MNGLRTPMTPVNVFLVEDNPADVEMTRLSLEETHVAHRLHVTRDGDEALAFLNRRDPYADAPRPDLTLLDLNLPRTDGRAVLAAIKTDESLKDIPVIVLTTSSSDRDISAAYKMHANGYITKPTGLDRWVELFRAVNDFWFKTVKLPPAAEGR